MNLGGMDQNEDFDHDLDQDHDLDYDQQITVVDKWLQNGVCNQFPVSMFPYFHDICVSLDTCIPRQIYFTQSESDYLV